MKWIIFVFIAIILSGCSLVAETPTMPEQPIPVTRSQTSELPNPSIPKSHNLDVPFTSQAPFANWTDFYNEACEEAALITVIHYLNDEGFTKETADKEIIALADYETANSYAMDITIQELAQIAQDYYQKQTQVFTNEEVTIQKIQELLSQGHPIIIPAAGQLLGNPNFRGDGPPYHMLVLRGYDEKYFYTNDPGTRNGENYKYEKQTLINAIHDWTGDKVSIQTGQKAMLIIW